jgi:hypothetical protein
VSYIFGKGGPLYEEGEGDDPRLIVEIGSWDGRHLSNSLYLLSGEAHEATACGEWFGILIEGDEARSNEAMVVTHRERERSVKCITAMVEPEGPRSLNSILDEQCSDMLSTCGSIIDVLSIDVDGLDYFIWEKFVEYRPKVVIIEFNPSIPNHIVYIQDNDGNVRQGSSLAALIELGKSKKYELVETTLYNAIFVTSELFPRFEGHIPSTNSIDVLHEVTMGTDLFQLYDGTLAIAGCKKLLWHRVPMDINKMQVIKQSERKFPFAPPPLP